MNSRDYWAKREEEALKHYVSDEAEYDKRVKQIHQNMLDAVQKEIDSFYGKYADKEGITIAEAKKRVTKLDIAEYERKAKRYVRDKDFSAKANEEMRLYNLTMKVNRLEMLKANIGLELIAGHDELEKFMGGILNGRTMEELERQAGILGKTVRNNAQKASAIVNSSFHNATFSDRVWLYQDLLRADIGKLLQSGLIQGKNPRVLAREIKKKFETSTFNAERLMRTELARVQTEAQKQSFKRNGFDFYEFIVNGGCCDICAALSGKHFKVDKMMPGENAPPMHPHCRCSTAAWEDSEEYEAWLDHLANGGTTEEWNKLNAKPGLPTPEPRPLDISKMTEEEFEQWKKAYYDDANGTVKLNTSELKALEAYGEGSYELLNAYGRYGEDSDKFKAVWKKYGNRDIETIRQQFNDVQSALGKFQLNEAIVVHRAIRDISYITDDVSVEGLKNLKGKTITEGGFVSTSLAYQSKFEGRNPNAVHMELVLPKGTRGAYIDKFVSKDEHEFLLGAGTKYTIIDGGERTVKAKKYDFANRKWIEIDKKERFLKVQVIPEGAAGLPKATKTLTNSASRGIKTVEMCIDFDELATHLSKSYGISMDNAVKTLDFGSCRSAMVGVEKTFSEFSELKSIMRRVSTDTSGFMSCSPNGTITFNPVTFANSKSVESTLKTQMVSGYWVKNSSVTSIGVHESSHLLEWELIEKSGKYTTDLEKTVAWNSCTEAKEIVSQACKNIKKTEFGKGKTNAELRRTISGYATTDYSEALADSFEDVFANGENASPLAHEIRRLTIEKLEQYGSR